MQNIIEIECPPELLIGLNTNAENMAQLVRREAALGLFRDGRISSGMASRWLRGSKGARVTLNNNCKQMVQVRFSRKASRLPSQ